MCVWQKRDEEHDGHGGQGYGPRAFTSGGDVVNEQQKPLPPPELMLALRRENDRQMAFLSEAFRRWPAWRREIAEYMLGAAMGVADMFGADAEGLIKEIRSREPKPEPLKPPRSAQS